MKTTLNYDMIEYIMNIKDKEEKLDKIEKQQKKNYKFVINELKTTYYQIFDLNRDIVACEDFDERPLVSIIDYLNLRKKEIDDLSYNHHLQNLEDEVRQGYEYVMKELKKEPYGISGSLASFDKDCLMQYFQKEPVFSHKRFMRKYNKRLKEDFKEFDYYIFIKWDM